VAQNPNPQLQITSYKGVTRTLDDWATVFNLAIIVVPDRPEGSQFVPVIERIFATFGESDADRAFVESLGLDRLPAFVHLRQDTTLVTAAQGWSPTEWQRVADQIAKHEHWTSPVVTGRGDPAPTPGWPIAS